MSQLYNRVKVLAELGQDIERFISGGKSGFSDKLSTAADKAYQHNQWFTPGNIKCALSAIAFMLGGAKLEKWMQKYPHAEVEREPKKVAIIMAGNIPMAGFHDLLSVLITGHHAVVKLSSSDRILLPFLVEHLNQFSTVFKDKITIVEKVVSPDAVIASGSNNSSRYFDYYFGRYPNIIRKHRNSVAVLNGNETSEELENLGDDIFTYFGLGCRNVSKLYVPEKYDFSDFWEAMKKFQFLIQHKKYSNNYDYYRATYMLNKIAFTTNDVLMLKEDVQLAGPVSVVTYERYLSAEDVVNRVEQDREKIQCVAGAEASGIAFVKFGSTQRVEPWDYADGIDTIDFLLNLH